MAYQSLEKLHQLQEGYRRIFKVAGRDLLLLQEEGRTYLMTNRCPHMDAPLHKASVAAGVLRCPVHGIEFDLRTGEALDAPPGCVGPLEFIPLIYEGNTVGIEV